MQRRTLLKGLTATAVGAPASLALPATSARALGSYDVAVCEQAKNQVLVHPAAAAWTTANCHWAWTAPSALNAAGFNTWQNLSDVKFRNTTAHGWVTLVTASNGRVGIVDIGDSDTLLWTATPYGNPHAVERIPGVGAVVVASSDPDTGFGGPGHHPSVGFVTVYAPQPGQADNMAGLTKVTEFSFNGAHGLWYDGTFLWVLGTDWLVKYSWSGSSCLDFRLKNEQLVAVSGGHSLDTDLSDPDYLLMTDGSTVDRIHKPSGAKTLWTPTNSGKPLGTTGVKAFSRVASGESFWVRAIAATDPSRPHAWWNDHVDFFDAQGAFAGRRTLSTGYAQTPKFYRARVSQAAFA